MERYFRESVEPIRTPLAVDVSHPFPFISNLGLNLAVQLMKTKKKRKRFVRIKVPANRPRWVPLSGGAGYVPLEQVIAYNLNILFPKASGIITSQTECFLTAYGYYFNIQNKDYETKMFWRSSMPSVRNMKKPVGFFLLIFMFITFIPHQVALAKMIGTQIILEADGVQSAREMVRRTLAREDVTTALVAWGIDVREARARINSLNDAEILRLADTLENAPAGGSALGSILGAAVIVFIVLLITDILGFTDIFTFVK